MCPTLRIKKPEHVCCGTVGWVCSFKSRAIKAVVRKIFKYRIGLKFIFAVEMSTALSIEKSIWVTEAMTGKCKAVPTYIKAFVSGAEVIIGEILLPTLKPIMNSANLCLQSILEKIG